MPWVGGIGGPLTGIKVHDEQGLSDEEKDGEEEEGWPPNAAGERKSGVALHALIPEAGPTKEDDEAPKGVKNRDEEEADSLSPGKRGSEHPHHVPGAVKVDYGKRDPGDGGKPGQGVESGSEVTVFNLPPCECKTE